MDIWTQTGRPVCQLITWIINNTTVTIKIYIFPRSQLDDPNTTGALT